MLLWRDGGHICMRQLVFSHLTRVQPPWLKCRLFPCLLMCLCCFVWLARKVLEGLQWKEGYAWLNNSPVDLLSLRSWRGWQRLSLAVSHRWLCCAVLGIARMGADSSQNPIWGWWCNPQHAVLTCHRNEINNISERSIPRNFWELEYYHKVCHAPRMLHTMFEPLVQLSLRDEGSWFGWEGISYLMSISNSHKYIIKVKYWQFGFLVTKQLVFTTICRLS